MCRTEQKLCFSFILNFLVQASSLHYPASWPRNLPGPGRLLPCFQVMQLAGQDDSLRVRNVPQALGFRCAHCTGEFATRQAMGCHRRTKFSLGTGCADPSNSKSVSFTGRARFSSSIVREHDFLGAHPNHTEAVYVHRQLLSMYIDTHSIVSHRHKTQNSIDCNSFVNTVHTSMYLVRTLGK